MNPELDRLVDLSLFDLNYDPDKRVMNPNADYLFSERFLETFGNSKGNYYAYTGEKIIYQKMDVFPEYVNVFKDVGESRSYPLLYETFKGYDQVVGVFPEGEESIRYLYNTYEYYTKRGCEFSIVFPTKWFYYTSVRAKALRTDLEAKSSFKIIYKDDNWMVFKFNKDTNSDLSMFYLSDYEKDKTLVV